METSQSISRAASGPARTAGSLVLGAALVLTGCVSSQAPLVAHPEKARAAVAFVADPQGPDAPEDVPYAVRREAARVFQKHGFTTSDVPTASYLPAFRAQKLSRARYEFLAKAQPNTDHVVLVETTARWFSQLSGQVKWTVDVRVTVGAPAAQASAGTPPAASSSASSAAQAPIRMTDTFAVFARYPYEGPREATERAASSIARLLDRALDEYLAREQR